jgi:hypothetical protein
LRTVQTNKKKFSQFPAQQNQSFSRNFEATSGELTSTSRFTHTIVRPKT